jgi:hypothetical protein
VSDFAFDVSMSPPSGGGASLPMLSPVTYATPLSHDLVCAFGGLTSGSLGGGPVVFHIESPLSAALGKPTDAVTWSACTWGMQHLGFTSSPNGLEVQVGLAVGAYVATDLTYGSDGGEDSTSTTGWSMSTRTVLTSCP